MQVGINIVIILNHADLSLTGGISKIKPAFCEFTDRTRILAIEFSRMGHY